jgi:hypothetical protein
MSYTIAIVTEPIPAGDRAAWAAVQRLIDAEGPAPAVFKELHDRLTAKYPCGCTVPDDQVDEVLWSDGPLWNNFGHRAAVLGMVYSKVEEGLPFVVKMANDLGLTVFDWVGPRIYRP